MSKSNINFRGWTNRHIILVQGQHLFYYTEFLKLQLH